MASTRRQHQESIAETLRDYRAGQVAPIDATRVGKWASQFNEHQELVLSEMAAILPRAYYSRERVAEYLAGLVTNTKLAGSDPCRFWRSANLMDVQPSNRGSSQRELLVVLRDAIATQCGPSHRKAGAPGGPFLYIDDGVFTGITIIRDIKGWLPGAPTAAELHIIAICIYRGGMDYATKEIQKAAIAAGKTVTVHWWSTVTLENEHNAMNVSDVLWPTVLPSEAVAYARSLAPYTPRMRTGDSLGKHGTFATPAGRVALEQAFLIAGIKIRDQSPMNEYQRPLGNMVLKALGFGALFATYRNCPNNCPLALWAGSPWVPLIPRKNN